MSTYRMLRSNREIGPYSLDEIISLGLKPYDLIWVDGKSAAWRYPSEIAELKPYAPVVEEQPYDRFFKRPTASQSQQEKKEPLVEKPEAINEKTEEPQPEKKPAYSTIVVVMPKKENTRVTLIKPVEKTTEVVMRKEKELPEVKIENTPTLSLKKTEEPEVEVVHMETKMERSLDEIKEMYVKTLHDRKERFSRRKRFNNAGRYAVAAFFVGVLGTLVFLTLTNKPPQPEPFGANTQVSPVQNETETEQPGLFPAVTLETGNLEENLEEGFQESTLNSTGKKPIGKNGLASTPPIEPDQYKENQTISEQIPTSPSEEGTREKKTKDEKDGVPRSSEELSRLVSVNANEYKRAAFGGIKDLQLTVSNRSSFVLDQVLVELSYLKPSELPLTTETITFRSVAPNGTMTIKIPDNNRGIKVSYKIKQVVSGQWSEEWAGNE